MLGKLSFSQGVIDNVVMIITIQIKWFHALALVSLIWATISRHYYSECNKIDFKKNSIKIVFGKNWNYCKYSEYVHLCWRKCIQKVQKEFVVLLKRYHFLKKESTKLLRWIEIQMESRAEWLRWMAAFFLFVFCMTYTHIQKINWYFDFVSMIVYKKSATTTEVGSDNETMYYWCWYPIAGIDLYKKGIARHTTSNSTMVLIIRSDYTG